MQKNGLNWDFLGNGSDNFGIIGILNGTNGCLTNSRGSILWKTGSGSSFGVDLCWMVQTNGLN